jgi:hypothetical protein
MVSLDCIYVEFIVFGVNYDYFIWFRFDDEDHLEDIVNHNYNSIIQVIEYELNINIYNSSYQIEVYTISSFPPDNTTIHAVPFEEEYDLSSF